MFSKSQVQSLWRDLDAEDDAEEAPKCILSRRVLVVGQRQYRSNDEVYPYPWNWAAMRRVVALDENQTPMAYRRLCSVSLDWDASIDLLPPGDGWDKYVAARAAQYVRNAAAREGFDFFVLLGGKVADAFVAADRRLKGLNLLEPQLQYLIMPSPHAVASPWWTEAARLREIRKVVATIYGEAAT